jgi:diguanylate cyclase (GGDEF)-like protein
MTIPYLFFFHFYKDRKKVFYSLYALLFLLSFVLLILLKDKNYLLVLMSIIILILLIQIHNIKIRKIEKKCVDIEAEIQKIETKLKKLGDKIKYNKMMEVFYTQIFDIFEKIRFENDYKNIFDIFSKYFNDIFLISDIAISIQEGKKVIQKYEHGLALPLIKMRRTNSLIKLKDNIYYKTKINGKLQILFAFRLSEEKELSAELSIFIESALLAILKIYFFKKYDNYSKTDYLTGLYKKRILIEILIEDFNRCVRRKMPLSVAFFDIDDFKLVNDNYGHIIGDSVLKIFSDQLKKLSDYGYFTGRYGGEEFVVIMIGVDVDEAYNNMEEVRNAMENYNFSDIGVMRKITVSCGIATYPDDGTTPFELLKKADDKMYRAKSSGKNRTEI